MNTNLLRLRCGLIAKDISPKDTMNLMRSIITRNTAHGFKVVSLGSRADYNIYLENGTRKSGKHVGFFYQNTAYAMSKYIYDFYNGQQDSLSSTYQNVAKASMANPAKNQTFLQSIAR